MLSAVITALLFFLMLLIVASFVIGALRERQRRLQSQALQERSLSQFNPASQFKASGQQVTTVLQFQNGSVVGLEKSDSSFFTNLLVQPQTDDCLIRSFVDGGDYTVCTKRTC